MATSDESRVCSSCDKFPSTRICIGCQQHFCSKDFKQHEQQLSMQFDHEVVRAHDELLDQIQKLEKSNYSSSVLLARIEEWKQKTIRKVEQAAEKAKHELMKTMEKQKTDIPKGLDVLTKKICALQESENFCETDIRRLRMKIDELRQVVEEYCGEDSKYGVIVENDEIDWNRMLNIRGWPPIFIPNIPKHVHWRPNGITVAGGNGEGSDTNQLCRPYNLFVDVDQTMVIADCGNHRIIQWKKGDTNGQVIAGGNDKGNRLDQLNLPTDLLIDKETNSLIITDTGNRRVVKWSLLAGTKQGEILIGSIDFARLAMDDQGYLYVSDYIKHEVRRYRLGDNDGALVAGGNGQGNSLNQLNGPTYLFVDRQQNVYISDQDNHRVMKWNKGAKEGIIVAAGKGKGNALSQLSTPTGIFIDTLGTVYVADYDNHRIVRWSQDDKQGTLIVGGNGPGMEANQLNSLGGLSFDRYGNLYVVDHGNHRIQCFTIK